MYKILKPTIQLCLACTISVLCFHSTTSSAPTTSMREGMKVTKRSGWKMPWSNQQINFSTPEKIKLESMEVSKRKANFDPKAVITIDEYFVLSKEEILIDPFDCVLGSLSAYQISEKIFAYEATAVWVTVSPKGSITHLGAAFILNYYDDDGDGNFETLEINSPIRLAKYIRKS